MEKINIEQTKISVSVRDLINGYTDTEEMGVYAFGGKLNVRSETGLSPVYAAFRYFKCDHSSLKKSKM